MKIDHNVPPPARSADRARGYTTAKRGQSKYKFAEMRVGDSFLIEDGKRHSVGTLAKKFGESQNPSWRFTVRPDHEGKLRCWRVRVIKTGWIIR